MNLVQNNRQYFRLVYGELAKDKPTFVHCLGDPTRLLPKYFRLGELLPGGHTALLANKPFVGKLFRECANPGHHIGEK